MSTPLISDALWDIMAPLLAPDSRSPRVSDHAVSHVWRNKNREAEIVDEHS
jgi:hypothetical protein